MIKILFIFPHGLKESNIEYNDEECAHSDLIIMGFTQRTNENTWTDGETLAQVLNC